MNLSEMSLLQLCLPLYDKHFACASCKTLNYSEYYLQSLEPKSAEIDLTLVLSVKQYYELLWGKTLQKH